MPSLRTAFAGLAALFLLTTLCLPAAAQPPAVPPPPISKMATFLPIADQLNQKLQSLVGTAAPASPATTAPAATTTPATPPDTGDENNVETQTTFGTEALNLILGFVDLVAAQGKIFVENFTAGTQVSTWLAHQNSDPHLVERWDIVRSDLIDAVGGAFVIALILELALIPARRHLWQRTPTSFVQQLGSVIGLIGIGVLPVLIFIGVALALLDQNEQQKVARFAVLNGVYALALNRLMMVVGRAFLAPKAPAIRPLPLTTAQASYLYRWLGLFSFVAIYGYFCVDVARLIRMPEQPVSAFSDLVGLLLVLMTLTVIVQKKSFVAVLLRGNLSAAQRDLTLLQSLRLWFARRWHILAIAYLLIGYLVTAFGIEGGFALLLRGTVLTLLVLATVQFLFYGMARPNPKKNGKPPAFQHPILRFFLRFLIWVLAFLGIAAAWGANIPAFLGTTIGQRLAGGVFSIGLTVIVLTLIYEAGCSRIERHLNRQDSEGRPIPTSARVRTLLPMMRNSAFVLFSGIAGLVTLSELGVNIGPLLAGAGVIGVAIGFGSQTLVKDFLTGLFIVLENTIAIGDVVKIGDHSGVVEAISIRTLRLRDADGAVHIMPFSEVSKIINMTKEFAYVQISVGVAYNTNLRRAMEVISSVGEELRADPKLRASIIDPVEIQGVDNLGDSSITLLARMRTRPGRQWDVKRAFLLRLKERFDEEKIEIPYPTVRHVTITE